MKITLSQKGNIAYIYLKWPIAPNEVVRTYPCDPYEIEAEINLDFDNNGMLLGIEVFNASSHLPDELLKEAEIIDKYLL